MSNGVSEGLAPAGAFRPLDAAAPLRSLAHAWDLLWVLARTEFRLRDQGSFLGLLWTLLYPVLHFLILRTVFVSWMGNRVEGYSAYLLVGVVQWHFFSSATSYGLSSLRRRAGLLHNYVFPRSLVVLASVLSVFLGHLLEWAVFLPVLVWLGAAPSASWLALPALILVSLLLSLALALPLSLCAVEFQDAEHLWRLALFCGFFTAPVFYSLDAVEAAPWLVALNPMTPVLETTRWALLGRPEPRAAAVAAVAAASGALLCAGGWAFARWSGRAAEKL